MEAQRKLVAQLPTRARGAYINKFRQVEVTSNHYEATLKGIEKVVVFDVKFTPKVESRADDLLKQIWGDIRGDVEGKIKKPVWRKFCIFSSEETPGKFYFTARGYQIEISQRKVHNVSSRPLFLLFLNISLKGIMSRLGYTEIGRSGKYFTQKNTKAIDNLTMYKGFTSTFQECQKGVFLRVDTARKIVRRDTVLEFINLVYRDHATKDKDQRRNEVKKALINSIVLTTYGKPVFYRVLDIEFRSLMDVALNEDTPNLKVYYKNKYNIDLKSETQPLLVVENKIMRREKTANQGPTYLLPELCSMTGIPDNFDEQRRKAISQQTILAPSDKSKEIQSFMTQLSDNGEITRLEELGIKLNSKLNKVPARQISNPSLELGSKNFVEKNREANFQLFGQPIFSAKHDITLCIIHTKYADVQPMIATFQQTAKKLKVNILVKKMETPMFKDRDVIAGVERALKAHDTTNIIMVVLPGNLKTFYPKIKQDLLLAQSGKEIISQFVIENTLKKKGAQSIHTKLLLQMIAKRGNILWVPSYSQEMQNTLDKTCIMGIDTASKGGITVMGGCGTTNSTFSLLSSSTVTLNNNDGDKYKHMVQIAAKIVEGYASRNKTPPKELIIFMLAVPGDQVNLLQENFAKVLEEKVNSTYSSHMKLTVVMVNLRNSQRFFTVGNETRNVPPGTLINAQIVSNFYDFYIISQQSTKGSIVPNHYKVIHKTSKLEEGHLQELIFSQCFNYCNWTGSIKIPAILQYTKKCVKFGAEVLDGKDVGKSLLTRPYFV